MAKSDNVNLVFGCEEADRVSSNEFCLDTTGVYLSLKKPDMSKLVTDDVNEEEERLKKLFLDNAFMFMEHSDRIFSDQRMFLCPLSFMSNGLAYTGESGFRNPTLGIYLQFWMTCPQANIVGDDGKKWMVYHIAGSPLSGCNKCGLVNDQGETKTKQMPSFMDIWRPFVDINTYYNDAKRSCDAYTLRQVLAILENEGTGVVFHKNAHILFLEEKNKHLIDRINFLESLAQQTYQKLHKALLELKYDELRAFMTEYKARKVVAASTLERLRKKRLELRRRLKSMEMDHIEYQKTWKPFGKEKKRILTEMSAFVDNSLQSLYPDDEITLSEVENFLDEHGDKK